MQVQYTLTLNFVKKNSYMFQKHIDLQKIKQYMMTKTILRKVQVRDIE